MEAANPSSPNVFISYSHDSPEHADRVLAFSDQLRADGIDCVLDQYEDSPPEGWPRWMDRRIRDADFILMICTATYYRRVMGEEEAGKGLGVRWEGNLIYQHIYNPGTLNSRFIPVLLANGDFTHIPTPLQGATFYHGHTPQGYEALYRRLTRQPKTLQPELGKLRSLPLKERKQTSPLVRWHVPERNTFFTGRGQLLKDLDTAFTQQGATALAQAISGLGGMGKTQTALEYAHAHRTEYMAGFWVRADSEAELKSGFAEMARLLDLPEANEPEQARAVTAAKRWLENHDGWLLVLDNADEPERLRPFWPRPCRGHILLTSRAQVFDMLGIRKPVEITEFPPAEALEFLLKRTGREEALPDERRMAGALAEELGRLPLALEQAGAYILAKHTRFQDYLLTYRTRRLKQLERSSPVAGDYPSTVATTWALNFQEVKNVSRASGDLLCVSALLQPDAIPLELLERGAAALGPAIAKALARWPEEPVVLDELLEPLTRFSLIRRDLGSRTYAIHRLVQEVLKQTMSVKTQTRWAGCVIRAMDQALPSVPFQDWPLRERVLPHAIYASAYIERMHLELPEAGPLRDKISEYLRERGRLSEAESFLRRVLAFSERTLGPQHLEVAECLNRLGNVLHGQERYAEAEPLHRRALAIVETVRGPEDSAVASSLNFLANSFTGRGRYAEAEPLLRQALALAEKAFGPEDPKVTPSLNNLAFLLSARARYAEAEALFRQVLATREKAWGPEHSDLATTLNNLAKLLDIQGRDAEAEPLLRRVLAIYEEALGPEHPIFGTGLKNYAGILRKLHRDAEAESMESRAKAIRMAQSAMVPKYDPAEAPRGVGEAGQKGKADGMGGI